VKVNSSYKMSKESKRLLMVTPIDKVHFMKKAMIEAEIAEAKARQAKIKNNSKPDLEA
jgi:hypothetical protein